ncbi:FAD-dependent monooxygenase [Streptomyces sp. HF10]|uniref:FAD-dependent monooxygenase n=1 Tax=Streptomyces sp. HF10 TaxID=2692233 RepID=UPI002E2A2839|nr:FAD-dependent monooxygenase [Streptomyces sp. HF10]
MATRGGLHGHGRGAGGGAPAGRADRGSARRRPYRDRADGPDGPGAGGERGPARTGPRRRLGAHHRRPAGRQLRRRGDRLRDRDPRGDLARLLYEASLPGTEYLFDDTVTALEQDADGVTVTFERAAPRRFGMVVGADGPHSVVRALAFGPEREFVRPLGLYTAWFTATDDLDLDGWYMMHNAPPGLVASARPGRLPGEIKAGLSFRSAPLAHDRRDIAAQHELLARRFARVGWQAPRLLRAMRTAPDFFLDSMGQVRLDGWSRGRVALLGDAGYCATPLTGLGTSLALVGAYVLAGELATAGGDHRSALRRYDEVMRPYVGQAQQLPPGGAAGYAPSGRLGIRLRDLSMRRMTRWPMRNVLAAQFAKAGNIELPDYGRGSQLPGRLQEFGV